MRGGKRVGAGRKTVGETVRVRVPVEVLDEVQALISRYREGCLKSGTEIKDDQTEPVLKAVTEIKDDQTGPVLKAGTEIKEDARIKEQLAKIRKLSTAKQRALKQKHGTLYQAAVVEVNRIAEVERNRPRLKAEVIAALDEAFWSERGINGST